MLDGEACLASLLWFATQVYALACYFATILYALWHAYCMCPAFVSCAARLKDWVTGRNIHVTRETNLTRQVSRVDGCYVFWTCLVLSTHHWLVGFFLAWSVWLTLPIFAAHTIVIFFLFHVCGEHSMFNKYLQSLSKTLLSNIKLYELCFAGPNNDVKKEVRRLVIEDRPFDALRTSHIALLICYAFYPKEIQKVSNTRKQKQNDLQVLKVLERSRGDVDVNPSADIDRLSLEQEIEELETKERKYNTLEARLFTLRFVLASAGPIVAFWCIFIGVGVGVFVGASSWWAWWCERSYNAHEADVIARVGASYEARMRSIQ